MQAALRQAVRAQAPRAVLAAGVGAGAAAGCARAVASVRQASSKAAVSEASGKYQNRHHSNAEELIAKLPVVEVDAEVAMCDGGGGSLGHPIEFIQLNHARDSEPSTCKYCGVRYVKKHHH